jgi:hypothetical protein
MKSAPAALSPRPLMSSKGSSTGDGRGPPEGDASAPARSSSGSAPSGRVDDERPSSPQPMMLAKTLSASAAPATCVDRLAPYDELFMPLLPSPVNRGPDAPRRPSARCESTWPRGSMPRETREVDTTLLESGKFPPQRSVAVRWPTGQVPSAALEGNPSDETGCCSSGRALPLLRATAPTTHYLQRSW